MEPDRIRPSFGFGANLTRLGIRLLYLYGAVYVIELLCVHWIGLDWIPAAVLFPIFSGKFHFWQLLTHPFIHDPRAPVDFVINCIILYFFAAPVEHALGSKRFIALFYFSALGGMIFGLLFSVVPGFDLPFSGLMPSLLALIAVFGLLNPEATILFMFILPVKAKYISYGTALITLLTFLAKINPYGAYHLGGMLFGYAYLKRPFWLVNPRLVRFTYLEWRMKQRRAKFRVINGEKNRKDGGPTYH